MTESIPPDEPQQGGAITPINQLSSGLDPIEQSLSEKMQLAQTPEEAQSYLNLIEQRQAQIERKASTEFQLQETKNQIKFERKLTIYDKVLATVLSLTSIIIGISSVHYIPLLSPLFIILGLIKPLEYPVSEVVELIKGLNLFVKPNQKFPADSKQERINKSNQEQPD